MESSLSLPPDSKSISSHSCFPERGGFLVSANAGGFSLEMRSRADEVTRFEEVKVDLGARLPLLINSSEISADSHQAEEPAVWSGGAMFGGWHSGFVEGP